MNSNTAALLSQLAAKLGTTAKFLWTVEMHQAYVQAVVNLSWTVVLIIGAFALYRFVRFAIKRIRDIDDEWHLDDLGYMFSTSIACAGIVACLIAGAIVFTSGLEAFLNPANFAFQAITSAL